VAQLVEQPTNVPKFKGFNPAASETVENGDEKVWLSCYKALSHQIKQYWQCFIFFVTYE
jgi:hypothetical protein